MQKMGVETRGAVPHLGCQHAGLAEPAHPVGGGIATEVGEPGPERAGEPRHRPRPADPGHGAARLVLQILRQVGDRRGDLAVDRVAGGIGGVAQRTDVEAESPRLEGAHLLGDEGLRQPRVALEDEDGPLAHADAHASSGPMGTGS